MIPYSRTTKQNPEAIVLEILSKKHNITTKKVYEFFLEKYDEGISLQGFYKIIRQLLRDRIIVKNEGLLSLDISWVNNLKKFTEVVEKTYLSSGIDESTIILEEGERSVSSFADVIEMDNFWDHALLLVMRYYHGTPHSDKNIYSKNFYSWIQVVRTESTQDLCNSYKEFGHGWYMASGSHTLLNSLVPHLVTSKNFHFSLYETKAGNLEQPNNFHITVIGDFIFETKLPFHLFEMVKKMFEDTKNISDLSTKMIENEMHKPAKTTLTITRDKIRAKELRNEIKNYFGDSIKLISKN